MVCDLLPTTCHIVIYVANYSSGNSCHNLSRRDVAADNRSRTNDTTPPQLNTGQYYTVCPNEHVVTDADKANARIAKTLLCARIMSENVHSGSNCHIIPDGY